MLRAFCACLALALVYSLASTGPADAQYYQQQRRRQPPHQQQQQPQPQPQPEPPPPPPQPAPQAAPAPTPAPPPIATPTPAPPPVPAAPAPPRPAEPVPVRIVEPAKSAEQQAREQREQQAQDQARDQERAERETFNNRLLMYSGLLVAVGVLLAIAFLVQTLYMLLALRSMRKAARVSQRNMTTAQRAFLYLGATTWSPADTHVKITPTWANSGTTPTRNLRISTNWKTSHGEMPADFVFTYVRAPERLFLGPNGRADVGAVLIPMRDIQAAIEDRVNLYFWGRATYEDMFEGSEPHFLEFCYRLDVSGATPDKIKLTFMHYGAHNRSDEDSQRSA
ncbi:hypothetical protein [Rhodoplanes sp. Z2-YC6860]|uniref:hypothetical protein n=1 Tax=Rhodoplanes sp. Z2-YC6860 TaxID=674703 RepID=UPI0012EEC7DE|nr:hypothetical protein [Rhodoplanes sp. Z2-YC6860]